MNQIPFGPEDMARRRKRSIAMGLILAAMVILFFVTTYVRVAGSLAEKSM